MHYFMPFCFNVSCYFLIYVLSIFQFNAFFVALVFFFLTILFLPTFSGTQLWHKTMPWCIHFHLTIFFFMIQC